MSPNARRRTMWVGLTLVLSLGLISCSTPATESSKESTSASISTTSDAAATASSTDAATTVDDGAISPESAAELVERATTGLIYSPKFAPATADITDAHPDEFEAVSGWAGPTEAFEVPKDRSVVLISCAAGTTCQTIVDKAKELIESFGIGWKVHIVSADGTPESFTSSFESALTLKPDAIVGVAVADTAVAAQLERAKELGITTIGPFVEPTGDSRYDSYVSNSTPGLFALEAFSVIAHSNGTANVLVVHDGSYPNLDSNATKAEAILERCAGCTVYRTDWTSEQAQNPVDAQQIISASLRAHPDIDYILMPYDSLGLPATVAAANSVGRDINVVAKDGFAAALQLVASGEVLYNAGFDNEWIVWVTIDQVFRAAAGVALVPDDQQGLPIHLFNADNVPADGVIDFSSLVDYRQKYRELWGLN